VSAADRSSDHRRAAADQARRAVALLDLTDLGDHTTDADVDRLCARADGPHGAVAAVCVWPRFVTRSAAALAGSGVHVATVVNFPSGSESIGAVLAMTAQAISDGADEIDLVLPYLALAGGNHEAPAAMVDAVRGLLPVGGDQLLKVILETGELVEPRLIDQAARLAIRHGADFIKTSTGKTPVSATTAATAVMLRAIADLDPRVGLKPSGGIRSAADAQTYLDQADHVMGPDWVSPRTFRFGASGLLDALAAVIEGDHDAAAKGTGY
jgi:deoxyribose-phosphate aldolase